MSTARSCRTRSTKPGTRRTKSEIEAICDAIYEVIEEDHPTTNRHVFYVLANNYKLVEKKESEYKGTICRLLTKMRKDGRLPYDWLSDNTRWRMKPTSHGSLFSALYDTRRSYRRALWNDQDAYVEVWTEKDAIAGILYEVTAEWDVPLMTARGYASRSFLYSVAEDLKQINKPSYLYYFGDHDPSGKDARRFVEATIREMAPDVEVYFELVAVTPEQIEEWDLPTRPTKTSDTRAKGFKGRSVEVDAIAPRVLKQLVRDCIEQHVDQEILERTRTIEEAERDTLQTILNNLEDYE